MHELLYLKDEQIKAFIEKIFIAYRESFSDSKTALTKHSIGLAHHKVIHLLSMYNGITISNLLKKLRITKQSLNRVLNDLIKNEYIFFIKGKKLFYEIFLQQKKRIFNALKDSDSDSVIKFKNILNKIINE